MILTANEAPPGISALRRRIELIHFGVPEAHDKREEQAAFRVSIHERGSPSILEI